LQINDSVHIAELPLPQGCKPTQRERDFTIATIVPPHVAVEEPAAAAAQPAAAAAPEAKAAPAAAAAKAAPKAKK
jgi:large subunit ribosomal protein L25